MDIESSEANSCFRINNATPKMAKNEANRTQPKPKASEASLLESARGSMARQT